MTDAEKRAFAAGIEAAAEKISARVDELKQQQEDDVASDTLDGYGSGLLDEAEGLLEEIRALTPSAPAPVVPKVKPLVWEDFDGHGAKAAAWRKGNYLITYWKSRGAFEVVESYPGYQGECIGNGFYPTLEAAKAAAQTDYEARVLSQLDMAPVTVPEAARVVLMEWDWPAEFIHGVYNSIDYSEFNKARMPLVFTHALLRALAEQEGK